MYIRKLYRWTNRFILSGVKYWAKSILIPSFPWTIWHPPTVIWEIAVFPNLFVLWSQVDWVISQLYDLLAMRKVKVLVSASDSLWPMDYSPPGSFVYGILQARILEWVAIPFSRESSCPRDWNHVSHIASRFFTIWAMRKPYWPLSINLFEPIGFLTYEMGIIPIS